MRIISISLKEEEWKILHKIKQIRNIRSLHRTVKLAIEDYIKNFKNSELHHRMPDGKIVKCNKPVTDEFDFLEME